MQQEPVDEVKSVLAGVVEQLHKQSIITSFCISRIVELETVQEELIAKIQELKSKANEKQTEQTAAVLTIEVATGITFDIEHPNSYSELVDKVLQFLLTKKNLKQTRERITKLYQDDKPCFIETNSKNEITADIFNQTKYSRLSIIKSQK